ncbi:bifunctional glutamate N-acetyltransferase/amino-acid acetyltransferase ArgJ [Phenylobacterium sp. LH3H17]|uniref:bifunctional glutamate N-acetyltransferase/amino-acid acetyltransferase ArgJ n=1 Tax=Phenylobacterium sp. LH3H17 TaxID=2903901 RepID=UPI0020C993E7|nr:bifunctional glutamate N-acetyltransferase/amino-acid acetyltransferase ArgJ [Phenylobacterium sp. LH3H17]UTP40632.1 bifunctional glutamate N-acetyltransferase/amino-acid acetyltransferase ArgJ [Phenylobacterium sp. LH3H17]
MTRKPVSKPAAAKTAKKPPAGKARDGASIPAEVVESIERALDPLTSALKRAALKRSDRQASQFTEKKPTVEPPVAKGALPVSPLAVPFPKIPPIPGVQLATGRAGFYKHDREDLLVMRFAKGTSAAGVFTRHGIGSAPVDWCKKHLEMTKGADVRALVVNAGCANSFTGKPGADAVRRVASAVAKRFDCRQRDVMVASTGVIGVLLDDGKITHRLPEVESRLIDDGWAGAANAIMTTDTFPKGAYAEATIDGEKVRIAGICKGSGMIAPDMATMLAFVATDAAISPTALQNLASLYTRTTFNCVTVDGDRSTNDTLLLFATGQSGAPNIARAGDKRLADFRDKLEAVLLDLALQLVRDGEGASKFVKITVTGAESPASARKIARTIAESPLVKTAFAGEDANWGRIVMAVGRADEPIDRDRVSVKFGPMVAAQDGLISPTYDEAKMSAYMKNQELEVAVDVGVGKGSATVWTCDLTKQYVAINGDYRS